MSYECVRVYACVYVEKDVRDLQSLLQFSVAVVSQISTSVYMYVCVYVKKDVRELQSLLQVSVAVVSHISASVYVCTCVHMCRRTFVSCDRCCRRKNVTYQ